jgi:phytoene dehydrogenase-like protein
MSSPARLGLRAVADAVVIGAGPNGLVAANVLADAGWDVVVLEANAEPGGAVRTAEVTAPGFRNDLFSAFYPLGAASPVLRDLHLDDHGLRWTHAPTVLAHPIPGRSAAVLHRDVDLTAASLELGDPGDGDAYRRALDGYRRVAGPMIDALLRPFPPVRAATRLVASARVDGIRELARLSLVPLRRYVEEQFRGDQASLLFAGMALHADLTPETAGSALFGWLLTGLGQELGFPVPVGGAGRITDALVQRLTTQGGELRCGARVAAVTVRDGRAVGVRTVDGDEISVRRAVLADTDVDALMLRLVGAEHLPSDTVAKLADVQRSSSTFKVDWALSAPVPWSDPTVHGAGTVHLADSLDELTVTASELSRHLVPRDPFVLVGQMTTADATRSPAGTESLWAYTHVPQHVRGDAGAVHNGVISGRWDETDRDRLVERIEDRIERLAPGFRDRILARHVMSPRTLEAMDANLVGGDISGGTAQLHQQLVFRPIPGWARAETPIRGLYLASASAHPGGGVHGACGANAARAALAHHPVQRVLTITRGVARSLPRTGRGLHRSAPSSRAASSAS